MRLLTPLLLSAISASVLADDTEVYTGNGAGTDANIMFILNTSESMSTLANPTEVTAYDPDVVYDNSRFGFEPDSLYVYNAPVYELDFPQVDDVVAIFLDPTTAYWIKQYEVYSDMDNNPVVSCDISRADQRSDNPARTGPVKTSEMY